MSDNPTASALNRAARNKKCTEYEAQGITPKEAATNWAQTEGVEIITQITTAGQDLSTSLSKYESDILQIKSDLSQVYSPNSLQSINGELDSIIEPIYKIQEQEINPTSWPFKEENLFNLVDSNRDPFLEIRQFLEEIRTKESSLLSSDYSSSLGTEGWSGVRILIFEASQKFNINDIIRNLEYLSELTEELKLARSCLSIQLQEELSWAKLKDFIAAPVDYLLTGETGSRAREAMEAIEKFESEDFEDLFGIDYQTKEQCFLTANILNFAEIKERIDDGVSTIFPSGSAMATAENAKKKLPNYEQGILGTRSVMLTGDTFALLNNLTQSPDKGEFYNITNSQLSVLQPMVRLFKSVKNESLEGSECDVEREIEIKFDANAPSDIEEILKRDKSIRNPGVGLKSFNFAYEGDNPFAVKKSITATLTIHANSFSELLQMRNENTADEYRYVDLALKTGTSETLQLNRQMSDVEISNLEKLNFRLKAVVGWQNPMFQSDLFSANPDVLNGINNSAITLNLTPTVHDFSVDDMGRVTFTINYLAYAEDYFDNPNFNIFSNPNLSLSTLVRKLILKQVNRRCDGTADKYKQSEILEKIVEEEKEKSLRFLMTSLMVRKKIYFLDIDIEEIQDYSVGGRFNIAANKYSVDELEAKIKTIETIDDSDREDVLRTSAATQTIEISGESEDGQPENDTLTENTTMSFIYAVDLIDAIMENIGYSINKLYESISLISNAGDGTPLADALELTEDSDYSFILNSLNITVSLRDLEEERQSLVRLIENYRKLRVLLGPVEIVRPNSYNSKIINLGDIPISIKHLMQWFTTKLLKKEQAQYYLTPFLNGFFNTYIIDFLKNNTCYGGKVRQKIKLFQAAITEYKKEPNGDDTITELCKQVNRTRYEMPNNLPSQPLLNVMGVRDDPRVNCGIKSEINYLAFYAGLTSPLGRVSGNRAEDHAKGIFHYQIGRDRGIVKTINLSKTTSTGLAEVRFEQDGYDGLKQLRVLYDTTINTYLDVGAFPGTYIYVEPRGFDPSGDFGDISLTDLGIGGYCMIWKSEHTIQPGLAESTLHAKWVSSKDGDGSSYGALGDGEERQKCSSNNRD